MFDIAAYGASPSVSDNAPAINAAINAAYGSGGGIVIVPPGRFRVTSQIVLKRGVGLQGISVAGNFYVDAGFDALAGSVIDVQWGMGAGTSNSMSNAAVLIDGPQCSVQYITFDYGLQDPTVSIPTEYGPTIGSGFGGHVNTAICGNWFNKAYVAIDMRGSAASTPGGVGYVTILGNSGCPIFRGIRLDFVVDWIIVQNNTFNSGLTSNSTPGSFNNMTRWSLANGWAFELGAGDWVQIQNCSAWGYFVGCLMQPDSTVYHGSGPYLVQGCNFDACLYATFLLSPTHSCIGVDIHDCTFAPFNPATGAHGMGLVVGDGVVLDSLTFSNNRVFASPRGLVWGAGAGTVVKESIFLGNIATGDHTDCAFVLGSGTDMVMSGNIVKNFAGLYSFNTMPNLVNVGNVT